MAMKRIAALPLEAEPGTRFRYSDVGFIVLGELIERISGQPLDQFARDYVFAPLGMHDTGFKPDSKIQSRLRSNGEAKRPLAGGRSSRSAFGSDGRRRRARRACSARPTIWLASPG